MALTPDIYMPVKASMLGLSFVLLWIAQAPSLRFDAPPELAAAKSQLESVTRLERNIS